MKKPPRRLDACGYRPCCGCRALIRGLSVALFFVACLSLYVGFIQLSSSFGDMRLGIGDIGRYHASTWATAPSRGIGLWGTDSAFRRTSRTDRASSALLWGSGVERFRPITIKEEDWVFFVRLQKTGSETLWKALLNYWDGSVWGRGRRCSHGLFCGYMCEGVVEEFIEQYQRGEESCKLLVRGHINLHDYRKAVARRLGDDGSVHYLTMLRHPLKRVLSEYVHVTKNLAAQFGAHAYGRAWDYNYTGPPDDLMAFLDCHECRVGVSNRQTRMLAGLYATGLDQEVHDEELLRRAVANLERMAYVGITERFEESMLLLKRTFPGPLARFCRYAYSRHQFDGFDPHASGAAVSRILELNALDLRLYERAVELFERRFQDMLSRVPLQVAHDRFVPSAGAPGLFTLQRVEPMPSPTDLRGGEEEQEDEDDEAEGQQGRIPRDMRPQKQEGVPKAVLGISNRRKVFAKDSWPPCRPVRVVSSADVKEEEGSPALLEQALERHRTLPRIQVANARDSQAVVLGPSNPTARCRVDTPSVPQGVEVKYEVYEPVSGISGYEVFARLDAAGPLAAMEACAAEERCGGFLLLVRDGHALLFALPDGTTALRMRPPRGHGGDGIYRAFIKARAGRPPALPPASEGMLRFPDQAFLPLASTRLAPPARGHGYRPPQSVVVSLTSIPSRVGQLRDTLESLTALQTRRPDRLILNVPRNSTRERGKPYRLPHWLSAMPLVQVVLVEQDYGPATKLIPTVQLLQAEGVNALVLVVDDDTHYPPTLIETLLRWHELLPHAALALRGWVVHQDVRYLKLADSYLVFGSELYAPHPVAIVTANCGYMVQTAFFDQQLWNFTDAPDGARWMDDVWISGHLARRGVPRFAVPFDETAYCRPSYFPSLTLDSISLRKDARYPRVSARNPREAANNDALNHFYSDWDVLFGDGYRVYSDVWGIPRGQQESGRARAPRGARSYEPVGFRPP